MCDCVVENVELWQETDLTPLFWSRHPQLGGMRTFAKAKLLLLELSYEELYTNQPLFNDI